MSKTLPKGICNFPVRMTAAEHAIWGRFTFAHNAATGENASVGDMWRRAAVRGMEQICQPIADEIKKVRAEHRAINEATRRALAESPRQQHFKFVPAATCLLIGLFAIANSMVCGDDELRRTRTLRVRGVGSGWVRVKEAA